MSQSTMEKPAARGPLNGVDTPTLFATIDVVAGQPDLAKFTFRARNTWQTGTYSRTSVTSFYGAGSEHEHVREFLVDADHPAVLVGEDRAPLPVELLLAALASCLTGGIGNIASARGVTLREVTSTVEGELDVQGILGLSPDVRNGFSRISVDFHIEGDAPPETLRRIVEQSRARSAVFDIITNQVPVDVTIDGA
ncbi:MAG: OsmC family protein [Longimicrobiales bacterium]